MAYERVELFGENGPYFSEPLKSGRQALLRALQLRDVVAFGAIAEPSPGAARIVERLGRSLRIEMPADPLRAEPIE